MRRTLTIGVAVALLVTFSAAVGLAGLRVVLIAPSQDRPGRTIIATGLRELRLVDSPEAYCKRSNDSDPTCPISFTMAIGREGNVLATLPYIHALNAFTRNEP